MVTLILANCTKPFFSSQAHQWEWAKGQVQLFPWIICALNDAAAITALFTAIFPLSHRTFLFLLLKRYYLSFCIHKHRSVKKVHEWATACLYCSYFLVVRGLCEGSRTDFCGVGTGLWRGPCRHTLGWGTCSLFSHLLKDLQNKESILTYRYIPNSPRNH